MKGSTTGASRPDARPRAGRGPRRRAELPAGVEQRLVIAPFHPLVVGLAHPIGAHRLADPRGPARRGADRRQAPRQQRQRRHEPHHLRHARRRIRGPCHPRRAVAFQLFHGNRVQPGNLGSSIQNRSPRCIRPTQAAMLGLDQSDQSTAIVVKVAAVLTTRIAKQAGGPRGPLGVPPPLAPRVELDVDQHQGPEDPPEERIGAAEAPGPPQPERLVGVQRPGGQEDHQRRDRQRDGLRPALQAEDDRVEDDPHHEVFPVDVDPPPVVGESGRQQVVVVGLGEPEAEQVEHAAGHVELARDAEVEQVVGDQVERQARRVVDLVGGDQQLVVDHPVEQELDRPAEHHRQARLLHRVDVARRSSRAGASGSRRPGSGGSNSWAGGRSSSACRPASRASWRASAHTSRSSCGT